MPKTTLFLLVGVHLLIGMALSGFDLGGILIVLHIQAILLSWFFVGLVVLMAIRIAIRKYSRPHIVLVRTLNMERQRLFEGAIFFTLLAITMQAYMLIKVAIPSLVPYYADLYFANIDHAIFGTDPWRITHALISPAMTVWVDRFYLIPCLIVSTVMTFWVCFSKDAVFRRRAAFTIALVWFLGGDWVALMLSSAGPVYVEHFYGIARFVPLHQALSPDLTAVHVQQYLLDHLGHPSPGTGISASPSMHNATYLMLVTFIYHKYGMGWRLAAATLFEALVFISSIHLGWHYASDTIMSIIVIIPIWRFAGYLAGAKIPPTKGFAFPSPSKPPSLQPQI